MSAARSARVSSRALAVLLTCEHAGRRLPARHRHLFAGRRDLLDSHRAWDPGAFALARRLRDRLAAPLYSVHTSRLLVEANRSPHNPRLWSELARRLTVEERDELYRRVHRPHWRRVESWIGEQTAAGHRVVHLSSHSFTPVLDGRPRRCDVGILYDPAGDFEREVAGRIVERLRADLPDLRILRNAPYRGVDDGLTRAMRRRFAADRYAGIELEVNQRFIAGPRREWRRVRDGVVEAVAAAVEGLR